jgi:predicted flap endonuclease-1-like 5' DNA nuclease
MTVRLDNPSCTFRQCCRHVNFSKKFREIDRQKKNSANVVMLSVSFEELSLHGKRAAGRARERQRRSIGANAARNVAIPSPDLLTVPGIGPRNMEKLVAKGIAKLANLKQLYLDKVLLSNYL